MAETPTEMQTDLDSFINELEANDLDTIAEYFKSVLLGYQQTGSITEPERELLVGETDISGTLDLAIMFGMAWQYTNEVTETTDDE